MQLSFPRTSCSATLELSRTVGRCVGAMDDAATEPPLQIAFVREKWTGPVSQLSSAIRHAILVRHATSFSPPAQTRLVWTRQGTANPLGSHWPGLHAVPDQSSSRRPLLGSKDYTVCNSAQHSEGPRAASGLKECRALRLHL
jgi:hypothetical protein